jgi:hypothetical protein
MKLNIKAFALTFGVFWGIGLFLITWWLILLEGSSGDLTLIGRIYPGFNISPIGSVIGLVWGFFDGLICGGVFAWLYNLIVSKLRSPLAK